MRSIAVANLKGGSAKTTTALCLAVRAAMRGRRVLLLDSDPQGNSSAVMLDGEPAADPTLSHVLLDQVEPNEAIRSTRIEGLDVLPADGKLADATLVLADQLGRERRLRVALETIAADYDLVVVDAALRALAGRNQRFERGRRVACPGRRRRVLDLRPQSIAGIHRASPALSGQPHPEDRRPGDDQDPRQPHHRTSSTSSAAHRGLVHQTTIPHSVRVEEAQPGIGRCWNTPPSRRSSRLSSTRFGGP